MGFLKKVSDASTKQETVLIAGYFKAFLKELKVNTIALAIFKLIKKQGIKDVD